MMLMLPLTRGSIRKLRPVISATALTTASMSALTKLSVTVSSAAAAIGAKPVQNPKASATIARRPRRGGRASANEWTGLRSFVVKRAPGRTVVTAPEGAARGKLHESERAADFRSDRAVSGIIACTANASATPKAESKQLLDCILGDKQSCSWSPYEPICRHCPRG